LDLFYRFVVRVALLILKVMDWRADISGAEHIPRQGPAVIASNHIGYLDFVFLGIGARHQRRLVRFMAMEESFRHPVAGPMLRAMKHIPVDRYGEAAAAVGAAVEALRRGEVVGLHPEGMLSRSFVVQEGKTGAVRMAQASGAPIVPAAIWGTQRILPPKGRRPRWPRHVVVSVRFGEPVPAPPDADPVEVTRTLMQRITELVDEVVGDYPQHPKGPADNWWVPAHLGGSAPTAEKAAEESRRRVELRKAERRRTLLRRPRSPVKGQD
jgi:1-acyl-sn-glycerol-3-phosphate acyltransferase